MRHREIVVFEDKASAAAKGAGISSGLTILSMLSPRSIAQFKTDAAEDGIPITLFVRAAIIAIWGGIGAAIGYLVGKKNIPKEKAQKIASKAAVSAKKNGLTKEVLNRAKANK